MPLTFRRNPGGNIRHDFLVGLNVFLELVAVRERYGPRPLDVLNQFVLILHYSQQGSTEFVRSWRERRNLSELIDRFRDRRLHSTQLIESSGGDIVCGVLER